MGTRPAQGTRGKELPRLAFQLATGSHVFWYRLTRGLLGHRLGPVRTLLLDHVGSKSQKRHTTPLTYGRDGQNLILVASKGGSAQHPAWYPNLVAHPDTEVQGATARIRVRAR